jgi:hypothetical protein
VTHGRIEGVGVPVDIETEPAQALEIALELAQNRTSAPD